MTKMINVKIDEEIWKEYKEICAKNETTPSIQIRKAVKNYIEENKNKE